jgi:hypothetical protein
MLAGAVLAVVAVAVGVQLVPRGTSTPVAAAPTGPAVPSPSPRLSPTPPPDPATLPISAFGDSVMLGARAAMEAAMPNISVNAVVSAQYPDIYGAVREAHAAGTLKPIVVIQAGANGRLSLPALTELLDELGKTRLVVVMTVHLKYPAQQAANNEVVLAATAGRPNVLVADWLTYSTGHRNWFLADQTHVSKSGGVAFAELIVQTIAAGTT